MSDVEKKTEIRIKDFKIEELKSPYSDTQESQSVISFNRVQYLTTSKFKETLRIPLVYAIVETPDGEKKIELGINVEDIPSIAEDNVKLVTIMIKALIKELGINVEDIVEYTEFITRLTTRSGELASKLMEAYRKYYHSLTGIGVRELEEVLPPKEEVYIERQLKTVVNNYLVILHEPSKKPIIIGYGAVPKETSMLIRALQKRDIEAIEILENLGVKDIDIDKVNAIIKPIPYLRAYKSGDIIILSREPLPRGEVKLRLRIPTENELRIIFENLPWEIMENLIKEILKTLGIGLSDFIGDIKNKWLSGEQRPSYEEIKSYYLNELVTTYGYRIVIGERGLDKEYVDHYMMYWRDYIKRVFELIDGDSLIITVYKAMILPYYGKGDWIPHLLLLTLTNAGKTYLYRQFVGGDPLSGVTPKSLVGVYSLEEKRLVRGILHGRYLAVQIESLESNTAKDVLAFLIDYMKSGRATRGVSGREITVRGKAPIILTGNTVKTKKTAYTLQNWIKLGLLNNPEALSSRLLVFYKNTKRLQVKNEKKFERLCNVIRELRDSSIIRYRLRQLWELPEIENWIETPDKLDIDITMEEELGDLKQYFEGLKENFYKRLRTLALNNVLVDYLDQIYYNNMDYIRNVLLPQIFENAYEVYEYLKTELVNSILTIQTECSLKNPTILAILLPKPFRQLLVSINDYLHKQVLNKDIEKIDLDDLMEFMKSQGIKNTKHIKYKIKKAIGSDPIDKWLKSMGVYMIITDNKIKITIDTTIFNALDFKRLAESLKENVP